MKQIRGTYEGNLQEIDLVKKINIGTFFDFFTNQLSYNKPYCAIRITKNKYSNFSNRSVKPKSDIVLIEYNSTIEKLLIPNDYYLDETILGDSQLTYIPKSGISVKMNDSKTYQIHKFTLNSFDKVFNNKFLCAGTLMYSKNQVNEVFNREMLLKFWNISEECFFNYFSKNIFQLENQINKYGSIQQYCLVRLKEIVNDNIKIKQHIFTGKLDFEDPFCATFSFINNNLETFRYTDFYFSQGSNRKKNPTIVVKPKF